MPANFVAKTLPYSVDQLFDLVADIESYPLFLPWCDAARVFERDGDVVLADLFIGFNGVSGKYTSRVFLDKANNEISVELAQGPFKHLYQGWKFTRQGSETLVEFDIDFALKSKILEKIVDKLFDKAFGKMMRAFEARAEKLYKL